MIRHAVRITGWVFGCAMFPIVAGELFETRRATVVGAVASLTALLWFLFWLPRSAHRAFETARYKPALRRYRLLAQLAFSARRERAARLSVAACELAAGRHREADALLAAITPTDHSERVVWLNNRACGALDAGEDPGLALQLIEEAIGLRPDVPGVLHTRARALIAIGRLDDAIAVLEAMRAGGELPLRLEAERCRELAAAWERKGQRDYADDYRDRARLHAI